MRIPKLDRLPPDFQTPFLRGEAAKLRRKNGQLVVKRIFDIVIALVILLLLSPVILVLSIWIRLDSPGPVFYRQKRVTQFGRPFWIYKFRTMVDGADRKGSLVTADGDARITLVGKHIRNWRFDEIPQVFNVLKGDMTMVGTRPEVPRYVEEYTEEMKLTLLLPAGVTSLCSIAYKDERELLKDSETAEKTYREKVLPDKMKINVSELRKFSLGHDLWVLFQTVMVVFR